MKKKITSILATKGYVLPRVAEFYMVCPDSKEFYYHFKRHFEFIDINSLWFILILILLFIFYNLIL